MKLHACRTLVSTTLVVALVQGLKELSSLGVPVYVTETGIPDRTGKKREEFFKSYPPQVSAVTLLTCLHHQCQRS